LPVDSNFGVLKHLPEDNSNKGNMDDDNIMPVNVIYEIQFIINIEKLLSS
jgi:hypothetical protein